MCMCLLVITAMCTPRAVSRSIPSVMQTSCLVLVASLVGGVFVHAAENDTSFRILSRAFDSCIAEQDMFACLKVKAAKLLDRALAVESLPVADFLSISRDRNSSEAFPPQTRADLEASLPRDLGEKNSALDLMILDRLAKFLETRTVRLHLPKDVFEGRHKVYKKGGKGGGVFLVFGAFAAMLLQMALGKIAVIAGKALLVGKVALLLAAVIGLKSLLGHHGENHHTPQVIYAEPEHHAGWGRSAGDAQEIAYRGHRPSTRSQ